jgi:ERCC4-type nuclease
VHVEEARLPAGDYALAHSCLVERKAVRDLHLSLCSGRLWRQLGALRRSCTAPCLLVEGASIYDGAVGRAAIRGALLSIADLGVLVIRTCDVEESAHWIRQLHQRRSSVRYRDRVPYAFRYARNTMIDPAEQALAAAPGISTITAKMALDHFGSLGNVLRATAADLERIPGLGRRRAQAILELANTTRPSYSAKRNGEHRAT